MDVRMSLKHLLRPLRTLTVSSAARNVAIVMASNDSQNEADLGGGAFSTTGSGPIAGSSLTVELMPVREVEERQ